MHSLVSEEVVTCKLKHIVWSVNKQGLQEVCQERPQLRVLPNVVLVLIFNVSLSGQAHLTQ